MVHRKTAIVVLGMLAGTSLVGGSLKLASSASADELLHHRPRHHHRPPWHGPSGRPTPSPSSSIGPTTGPTPGPTTGPTPGPTTTPTAPPTTPPSPTTGPTAGPTATPTGGVDCATAVGNPATVASPGVGTVTVTIKVCGGTLTTVTSTQSQSNWDDNEAALPAMDKLALTYAKTDINMVNYSGATLTSKAYRTSLTSALSKAGN